MRSQGLRNQIAAAETLFLESGLQLKVVSSRPEPDTLRDGGQVGIFQQLLDGLPEQAALVDARDWTIVVVNDSWLRNLIDSDFPGFTPGSNYYRELIKASEGGYTPAGAAVTALNEIAAGKRTSFRFVYQGVGRQEEKTFESRLKLLTVGDRQFLRVTRYDVTERAMLRNMRRYVSDEVVKAQDEERRRMGRELHDSGMQLLAAMSLSLGQIKRARSDESRERHIGEMKEILIEAMREFRSVSFLSYPPQLERLGLVEALRALVQGVAERSGLKATFAVDGTFEITSPDLEHAIFRIAQEAVSNVYRHAQARTLTVRLICRPQALHLVIADDGRGIPADLRHGVGLTGMDARMRELGGRLTIHRGSPGTTLAASLPIRLISPAAKAA